MNAVTHIRKSIFGATQGEFAAIAQTTQATVSRWESGKLHPGLDELRLIRAAALERGLPWDDGVFFDLPADVGGVSGQETEGAAA
ncbi:helix-turn-helix domain-containing protein [Acuticoccus sediminis]|uniref:helix-turn-helix domain-containing protein n=1 Tax=Acuticoccus sediminis TaxID=2184697 RepID=UPI001CFDE156|nr:helix-turn-helix transcriptional regulator [Acuticoccus sediminis]